MRHVVPLKLLAPQIVEAICAGLQPAMLTGERQGSWTSLAEVEYSATTA
jgi:hypothetical protein